MIEQFDQPETKNKYERYGKYNESKQIEQVEPLAKSKQIQDIQDIQLSRTNITIKPNWNIEHTQDIKNQSEINDEQSKLLNTRTNTRNTNKSTNT